MPSSHKEYLAKEGPSGQHFDLTISDRNEAELSKSSVHSSQHSSHSKTRGHTQSHSGTFVGYNAYFAVLPYTGDCAGGCNSICGDPKANTYIVSSHEFAETPAPGSGYIRHCVCGGRRDGGLLQAVVGQCGADKQFSLSYPAVLLEWAGWMGESVSPFDDNVKCQCQCQL